MLDFGLARQYTNTTGDVRPVSTTSQPSWPPGDLTPLPCRRLTRPGSCWVPAAPHSGSTPGHPLAPSAWLWMAATPTLCNLSAPLVKDGHGQEAGLGLRLECQVCS